MRICVENGMFTVSFLKEGITKVGYSEFLLPPLPALTICPLSSVAGSMTCSRLLGRHVKAQTC